MYGPKRGGFMISSFGCLDPFPSRGSSLYWFFSGVRGRQRFYPSFIWPQTCASRKRSVRLGVGRWITCELSDINPILVTVVPKQGWCITQQALSTASHQSSWPFQQLSRAFNFKQRRLIFLNGYHAQSCHFLSNIPCKYCCNIKSLVPNFTPEVHLWAPTALTFWCCIQQRCAQFASLNVKLRVSH